MGRSTTPTKWFKAVKKAFRSPSKERPSPEDKKGDGDEKLLTKHVDFPPVSYPAPTITPNEVEPQPPPLPTPEAVDPALSTKHLDQKHDEVEVGQHHPSNNNIDVTTTQKHQDDDDDDSVLSEEEAAATRIQQRFSSPLALKGLIRLQALVRGQLVRRQAATTLRTMEAIVRLQALFRGHRVRTSKDGRAVNSKISRIRRLGSRAGEMELGTGEAEHEANKRRRRTTYYLTQQLKRSTPNRSSSFIDCDPDQPHEGWAWLELWTNAKAWENRQLELADSKLDPKDYIEIIPSSRKASDYTTKEVDANTLKMNPGVKSRVKSGVKYYENDCASNGASNSTARPALSEKKGFVPEHEAGSPPGCKKLTTPSPAVSEEVARSPQASDASVSGPETPPGVDSSTGDDNPSMAGSMAIKVFPPNGCTSPTPSDNFSTSNGARNGARNGVHDEPGSEEAAIAQDAAVNGIHQEDGDCTKTRKEESPGNPSKRTTCRYMAATESAKAKFRASRGSTPENPESLPGQVKQRNSIGGGANGNSKGVESPGKTVAFGSRKTTSNAVVQNRRSPSPKTGAPREKPRSVDAAGGQGGVSPARRNSLGGDDKRWRTW